MEDGWVEKLLYGLNLSMCTNRSILYRIKDSMSKGQITAEMCNNFHTEITNQNMSSNSIFPSILVFLILLKARELQQGKKCP